MKQTIIILNIISALAIIVQIVFFYLSALASSYNTGYTGNRKTDLPTNFLIAFLILLDIGIVYCIFLSHTLVGQSALLFAAIPAVVAIVLIVIFFLVIA